MFYNNYSYVINHYNLSASKKNLFTNVVLNKQTLQLVKLLYRLGAINSYLITKNKNSHYIIKFSVNMYKNQPFYSSVKLVSKPSQIISLKLSNLKLLHSITGKTQLILNTSKGLITAQEAFKYNVSGHLLCILY